MKIKTTKNIKFAICAILVILLSNTACVYAQSSSQGPKIGNTFSTTAIAGSSATWNNPANAKIADNTFSVNSADLPLQGNYTDYLIATNFSFTVPAGKQIDGIQVRVTRLEDSANAKDYRIRMIKGGVIGAVDRISAINWTSTNTTKVYGSSTDLWGDTWTVSDVNASNFGVAVAVQRSSNNAGTIAARIDNLRITVYYSDPAPPPLPVELTSFNAFMSGNKVSLTWQTASETNNGFFTLSRGTDPSLMEPIATINGNGNSVTMRLYSYIDMPEMINGNPYYYYQLTQTDLDGTAKVIGRKAVKAGIAANAISIYPNPFYDKLSIYADKSYSQTEMQITDMFGKTVYTDILKTDCQGEFEITLPEKLTPGIYYLHIDNGAEKIVKQIMKRKE